MESMLGLSVIRHRYKKPAVGPDILNHFNLSLDSKERNIALIGDRIMADTVMGHYLGFLTIDTDPLTLKGENSMVKCMRLLESSILPHLSFKQPPSHPVFETAKPDDLVRN